MENSMPEMSRKDLRAMAERMHAIEILGRRSNVYQYEAQRQKAIEKIAGKGATYNGIAYSAGTYGNTGRIDEIVKFNPKKDKWESKGHIFYTS